MTLCAFALVSFEFMPVSLLTPIATDLHLSEGQAGQAISACALAALITSLTLTRTIGDIDRRRVLLALAVLTIISAAVVAFAPNFPMLLVGRALVGIALGGFWSLSAATAMRLVPAPSVPKALAIVNAGPALASTVAAPIGSFLGGLLGWRGAFLSFIPLAAAALIWLSIALPSLPARRSDDSKSMIGLLRTQGVAHGYLGALAFFTGAFWLYTYLRPFLEQVTHVGVGLLSGILLLVGIAGFLGTAVIGRFVGQRIHLTLAALPAILAIIACGLAFEGRSVVMTTGLLVLWGFASTATPVVWWTWVTRQASSNPEAGGGLMVAVAQIGIGAGAMGGGVVFDASGPVETVLASSAILTIAALIAFTIYRRPRLAEASPA